MGRKRSNGFQPPNANFKSHEKKHTNLERTPSFQEKIHLIQHLPSERDFEMEVLPFRRPGILGYLHDRCNFQAKLARVHQRIGKNSNARGKPQYEGIPFMTVVAHQSQLDTLLGLKENIFHGCGSIEPLYAEGGEYTRYTPDSNSWRNSRSTFERISSSIHFPPDGLCARTCLP